MRDDVLESRISTEEVIASKEFIFNYFFETPVKVTIFHDGSNIENCDYNKTFPDVDYPSQGSSEIRTEVFRNFSKILVFGLFPVGTVRNFCQFLKILLFDGPLRTVVRRSVDPYVSWHCPSPEWGYPVAVFSMVLVSISASFRAGLPSKLTAQWFEPNEYDIANALASLADSFGTMIIYLLVPFVAKEPSDLLYLQVYFAIPVFLSFVGSLFIRQEGYKNEVNEQSIKVSVGFLII